MVVVADTTPLNYLILVQQIEILPRFFGRVSVPPAVWRELNHAGASEIVRHTVNSSQAWLDIRPVGVVDPSLAYLDTGEQEAITLALTVSADRVLLDEAEARREAKARGLRIVGTLGILREAARRDLLNLAEVLSALQQTSFFVAPSLIRSLLEEESERKKRA
jgi:predicted nucleic acid-binding protein